MLLKAISEVIEELHLPAVSFSIEHTNDFRHGDLSANVAFIVAKEVKKNPRDVAEMIVRELREKSIEGVEKIETAGPGFINFYLSDSFFRKSIGKIISLKDSFGIGDFYKGKKIMVEHTDPNPFKEFHIGHFMTNTIGTTISRLYEWGGAEVRQANYQGDVGLHVACAVWAMKYRLKKLPSEDGSKRSKAAYLAEAYVIGRKCYDKTDFWGLLFGGPTKYEVREQINEINKKIYDRSDEEINRLYDIGKKWSLDYFEIIYARLGSKFDFYFFESVAGKLGLELVRKNISNGIFEKSSGAIVFRGEKHALHTRVFINKEGLPTYESKELALPSIKYEVYPYDMSVVVTGNEVNDYFQVLMKVLGEVRPDLREKTFHVGHGMLRLPSGKMSSRTGDIITAESLIEDVSKVVGLKMKDVVVSQKEREEIIEIVSIGALKFSILRQAVGKDIIFDFDKSLSLEGDSGPYLQYTAVRARSLLDKAKGLGKISQVGSLYQKISPVERTLYRFPFVLERASKEHAPQLIVTYLLELAAAFNAYYSQNKIIDDSPESSYRLALTEAAEIVIRNGMSVLGIRVPNKM